MKEYEIVWEIFNKCSNNQMRDVFIEEKTISTPEDYIQNKLKGKEISIEKTEMPDGSVIFDVLASGMKERFTFTEI